MERRVVVVVFTVVMLTSCKWDDSLLKVVYGNYLYNKGEYGEATVVYLDVLEKSAEREWLQYNLANVYLAYGEIESALEQYFAAADTSNKDLLFRIHYNLGNIHYRKGNFEEAITEYIRALENNTSDKDAKYNLELSLQQLRNAQSNINLHSDAGVDDSSSLKEQASRMLDYIHDKERITWSFEPDSGQPEKSRDW